MSVPVKLTPFALPRFWNRFTGWQFRQALADGAGIPRRSFGLAFMFVTSAKWYTTVENEKLIVVAGGC